MRNFYILFIKEIKSYFFQPWAYVVLAFFGVINAIPFLQGVYALDTKNSSRNLVYWTYNNVNWFWLSFILLAPLLTMRLFAEEKKNGTIETLLTSPVSTTNIIFSKFTACLLFYILIWIPSFLNFYIFNTIVSENSVFTNQQLFCTIPIIILVGSAYIAVGCFTSALTENQIVSALFTSLLIFIHLFLSYLIFLTPRISENINSKLDFISAIRHLHYSSLGLMDSRPIILYLSIFAFFIYLTHQVINYERWKN